jgi:hypothetical protein
MIQRTVNSIIENFYKVVDNHEYINSVLIGPSYDPAKNGKMCVKVTISEPSNSYIIENITLDDVRNTIPTSFVYNGYTYEVEIRDGVKFSPFSCQEDHPEFYYWQDGSNVTNRDFIRPVKGGISITNYTDLSNSVGTFGFIAIDNDTNSVVGVTNLHVAIKDGFYASERNVIQSWYPIENSGNSVITQPNEGIDSGFEYRIGEVKKYQPLIKFNSLSTIGVNKVDSAVFSLDFLNGAIITNDSYNQLGFETFNNGNGLTFASTSEIDSMIEVDSVGNITINNELYMSSRTTGIKGLGDVKIFPIEQGTVLLEYNLQDNQTLAQVQECFTFVASTGATGAINGDICQYPAFAGDSGSAVIAQFNGEYKIVGQLFAGDAVNAMYGMFCRIDNIVESLNISPFNSSVSSYNFSDTSQTEFHYVEGLSDQKTLTLSGKTFWQVGIDFI